MQREIVKLPAAELRAYAGHRQTVASHTMRLTLIAHDIATDRNPDKSARLVGNAKQAMARGEFEFLIH